MYNLYWGAFTCTAISYLANIFRRLLLTAVFSNAVEVMTSAMTMTTTTTKRVTLRSIV